MKALVIAPQPFFTPRGTPFSVYYRTMISAELGVDIDLLTYGEGQDVDIPGIRILRISRFAFLGNVKTGPSALKLFLDVVLFLRAVWVLIRNKYDVVHAHEEAVFFCRFLKPLFGFKMIYDMHSSLPQQLTNFNFTKSKLLIGLFEKLENTAIKNSEAIITICPDLADYVDSLIGKHEKHFLIENSIFDEDKRCRVPSLEPKKGTTGPWGTLRWSRMATLASADSAGSKATPLSRDPFGLSAFGCRSTSMLTLPAKAPPLVKKP